MILLILLHALWGASLPISKWLLHFSPPILLAGTRMTAAGVVLLFYAYFVSKSRIRLQANYFWAYAHIIIFGSYLRYVLKYWALDHMSSAKVAFIINSAPFFAALFSFLLLKERLVLRQWLALVIGFFGLLPVLLTTSSAEQLMGELFMFSWPELAIISAVACCCYAQIVTRRVVCNAQCSLSATSGITLLGGGVLALLTAFFNGQYIESTNIVSFVSWLAILVVLSNVVCHMIYLYLLKRYSVTFLSLMNSVSPFFTALYGWYFLHETITWHFYASGTLILFAVCLFNKNKLFICRKKVLPRTKSGAEED